MRQHNIITIATPGCPKCSTGMSERRIQGGLLQTCPRCEHSVAIMLPLA